MHKIAIEILRDELFKVGGKLFAKAAVRLGAEARIENGDDQAKKDLDVADFAQSLFAGMEYGMHDEKKFRSLLQTIAFLSENKQQKD
jgi:hypothetical protein